MKIVAIIQARMRSERLPGKVLLPLTGRSTLWWICARLSYTKVNEIIIATTDNPANDPIADKTHYPYGCKIFRYTGIEDDVIGRVMSAANKYQADIIVDITGDCPMIDSRHVNHLINILLADSQIDYASNCVKRSWPDGLDIQVYKTEALVKTIDLFSPIYHHGGWNIAQHPDVFNIRNWYAPSNMYWPELGLTLDTPEDYELLKIIFDKFGKVTDFQIEDVIYFLIKNPKLVEINKKVRRKLPEEG